MKAIAANNYNPVAEMNNWGSLDLTSVFGNMTFPCKIKHFSTSNYAKFLNIYYDDMVTMEYKHVLSTISSYLPENYNDENFKDWLSDNSDVLYQYADHLMFNLP